MLDFGSIVLVPFPFADLSSAKVRPALVVSANRRGRDVILCFVTSMVEEGRSGQMVLAPNVRNGLKVRSAVRFDKIVTLEPRIILGRIGRVEASVLRRHRQAFASVFGFWAARGAARNGSGGTEPTATR